MMQVPINIRNNLCVDRNFLDLVPSFTRTLVYSSIHYSKFSSWKRTPFPAKTQAVGRTIIILMDSRFIKHVYVTSIT